MCTRNVLALRYSLPHTVHVFGSLREVGFSILPNAALPESWPVLSSAVSSESSTVTNVGDTVTDRDGGGRSEEVSVAAVRLLATLSVASRPLRCSLIGTSVMSCCDYSRYVLHPPVPKATFTAFAKNHLKLCWRLLTFRCRSHPRCCDTSTSASVVHKCYSSVYSALSDACSTASSPADDSTLGTLLSRSVRLAMIRLPREVALELNRRPKRR